jgi:hypothetical protein
MSKQDHPQDHTFHFRASGLALGGWLERPYPVAVPLQAAVVLPGVGGYVESSVENVDFRGLVSIRRATTVARGLRPEVGGRKDYETTIAVHLEGIDVLGALRIDHMTARLISRHPNERDAVPTFEVEEIDLGSVLLGKKRHDVVSHAAHFGQMVAGSTSPVGRKRSPGEFSDGSLRYCLLSWAAVAAGGGAHAPQSLLVTDHNDPRIAQYEKDLGRVVIGEVLVTPGSRRITMLRVELGCPHMGALVLGQVEGNGTRDP